MRFCRRYNNAGFEQKPVSACEFSDLPDMGGRNMGWRRFGVVAVVATLFGTNFMAQGDLGADEAAQIPIYEALVGLDGVLPKIDIPSETAVGLGVDGANIAERVNRQLRAANMRNFGREESVRQGVAELCVSIRAAQLKDPAVVAYHLDVALREPALLVRARERSIVAVTWQAPGVVSAVKSPSADSILRQIDEQIDYFIRSYRAANQIH
jgi:hypothetical protein